MFYIIITIQTVIYIIGFILNMSSPSGNLPAPIKFTLSLSFVVAALLIRHLNIRKVYTKFIAFGMVFCFLGDVINLNIIPGINSFSISTFLSIAFFGLAHLLFIFAYVKTAKSYGISVLSKEFYIGMVFYWVLTFSAWWLLVFSADKSFMALGVLVYGLWVSTMAAFSLPLLRVNRKYILAAAGSFMFVISDLFLAATGIGGIMVPFRDAIIWATYVLALSGIVYSGRFISNELLTLDMSYRKD